MIPSDWPWWKVLAAIVILAVVCLIAVAVNMWREIEND